ncbi:MULTISPECIES: nuclear transport factor 2 family protein [unclassified Isoptericola]|uniref:nuclear transport factor 2 family protein n=1 Tax=unclassified Isoptericola TaxID=2623355 RepID=UPI0035E5175D|nr:nuclear transport factor 2 family protein [Isoptericola sp. QY 916]
MTDPLAPLDRLLVLEELRRVQSRLCRAASVRDWAELESLFTPDGRFRAYGADGELGCFAATTGIGAAIDRAIGPGRLVVQSSDEELDVLADDRADGTWAVEDTLYPEDGTRARHGAGSLALAYRFDGGRWRVATAEFTRTAREHG